MKKYSKSKKSREILSLYLEFVQSYLTARMNNDEKLLKFLEDVAAATIGEHLAEGQPEQVLAVKRLVYVLEKQRAQARRSTEEAQVPESDSTIS